jgi:hypothetical protein
MQRSQSLVLLFSLLGSLSAGCGKPAAAPAAVTQVDHTRSANAGQCPKSPVLDDLEDGDHLVLTADGRTGVWYSYADETGSSITPSGDEVGAVPGGANGTAQAFHFKGHMTIDGVPFVGAGMLLLEPKAPYDASCCQGVSFWAKRGAAGTPNLRFMVGSVDTQPEAGRCSKCFDDFGKFLEVTEQWTEYRLPFAELTQESWGDRVEKLDTSRLYQLQWGVQASGSDFDFWLDEVSLYGCGG